MTLHNTKISTQPNTPTVQVVTSPVFVFQKAIIYNFTVTFKHKHHYIKNSYQMNSHHFEGKMKYM